MGLETVREEILDSAKLHAGSIISDAKKEAQKIAKEADRKVEELKKKIDEETGKRMETIKRQETASAELESKKALLEAKKQAIDNAFEEARKYLEHLDDRKKEVYMKKLLEKAKNDIEIGHYYFSEKDAKFLREYKAEALSILGGLIAENKEKTIRVDYSFDTILQGIKESAMQDINKILFV